MEDMAGKISELLSNPEGMDKIKSMAKMLFSEKESSTETYQNTDKPKENNNTAPLSDNFSLPEGIDIAKIMNMLSLLNSRKDDKRSSLLLALKPHLTQERQQRIDKAVKILQIISVFPLLKEQGLLELF